MSNPSSSDGVVALGRIVGLFGVRGWVKVYSYARPPERILAYKPWLIRTEDGWKALALLEGRLHGKGIVASLEGYVDRDQAKTLVGTDIAVPMAQLPSLPEGEYYWVQLQGLRVVNLQGSELGVVTHLFETGANDVMSVAPEETGAGERQRTDSRLIPYTPEVVKKVDLDSGVMLVDWGADF